MADENRLALRPPADLAARSSVEDLLQTIRPSWQAKSLIERVKKILPVDASSACQRLLNAAFQDLREKIVAAGLDIAQQAAVANKLPQVTRAETILDDYSSTNVLELAYRMGILSRPEWKRMCRAYEIRRDLEHEDDEYQAEVEDCVYIFRASIQIVLSREPIQLLRVADVKEFIEVPTRVTLNPDYREDFERAPDTRQREISEFLMNLALDSNAPDITRQNAIEALKALSPLTQNTVKIGLAARMQERIKRNPLTLLQAKVAAAGGFLPYLKQANVEAFYRELHQRFVGVGHHWLQHSQHSHLLDDFEDLGGLVECPPKLRTEFVLWMTLCYIGEPGERGWYGRNRKVFYSNAAAPRITRLFKTAGYRVRGELESVSKDVRIVKAMQNVHVARRFEELLDLTIGEPA